MLFFLSCLWNKLQLTDLVCLLVFWGNGGIVGIFLLCSDVVVVAFIVLGWKQDQPL